MIGFLPRRAEFWLGRAGSGKTFGCLQAIAQELIAAPRGAPLILLCPEQASAQMERRLATWPGLLGGFTRARVVSFSHLARLALEAQGAPPGRPLDDAGRMMLLARALRRQAGALGVFLPGPAPAGVAQALGDTLQEFQRYGWSAGDLERRVAEAEAAGEGAALLTRKLADLARLWRDLEAAQAQGGWCDAEARTRAAAAALTKWPALAGARVWVDGFASFTMQELGLLESILAQAESAVIALCCDPAQARRIEPAAGLPAAGGPSGAASGRASSVASSPLVRIGPERLFEMVEETLVTLEARLAESGWQVERVALPRPGQPTRFSAAPWLEHLERHVLGRMRPAPCPDEAWPEAARARDGAAPPLEFIEAADRRAEVEAVARRLVAACRRGELEGTDHPVLAWREAAVLTRDLEPYADLVRDVFAQFEIPYFLDRPREMREHPLARFLLTALAALQSGQSGLSIIHYMKTGLSGLSDDDAGCRLENLIRASDPEGHGWREPAAHATEQALLERWQAEGAAPLASLDRALRAGHNPGEALWRLLERVGAEATVSDWIAAERRAGRLELAQLHEQAWGETIGWLEQLQALAAADRAGFCFAPGSPAAHYRDYLDFLSELVQSALAATRARLVPPTLNQVLVGAVDRSRTPEVKLLCVLGLNDQEFPRAPGPDPVLGDEERAQLTAGAGALARRLGPDSLGRRLQEHFLAYIALTRGGAGDARARLVLSRPLLGEQGRTADASPYYMQTLAAYPRAPRWLVGAAGVGDDPALPRRPQEWVMRLGAALDAWRELGVAGPLARLAASGHPLAHPGVSGAARDAIARACRAFLPPEAAALDGALSLALLRARPRLKVTALEQFAECPFKFFGNHLLRLQTPAEARVTPMDLGTVRHALLHELYQVLSGTLPGTLASGAGVDWGAVDCHACDRMLDRALEALAARPEWVRRLRGRAIGALALRAAVDDLKLFVRALRLAGERSRFRQVGAEWVFGEDGALMYHVNGVEIALTGTIDRIDEAVGSGECRTYLLIDYKSGQRRINPARVAEGIELQLTLYAAALQRHDAAAGGRVRAVFYWPLSAPVCDPPASAGPVMIDPATAPVGPEWFGKRCPSGLFEEGAAGLLDSAVGPEESSPAFGFRRTAAGKLSQSSGGVVPPGALGMLLDQAEHSAAEMFERIAAGEIAARPYVLKTDNACAFCELKAVCRLSEPGAVRRRLLNALDRKALVARLEEALAEGSLR